MKIVILAFIALVTGIVIGRETTHKSTTTYLSSMAIDEPIHHLLHVSCRTGEESGRLDFDARSIGIVFDHDGQVRILPERNTVAPNRYDPNSDWLDDAGLCKVYAIE